MKYLMFGVGILLVGYGATKHAEQARSFLPENLPFLKAGKETPPAPTSPQASVESETQKKIQECHDLCEQGAVTGRLDSLALRECQHKCGPKSFAEPSAVPGRRNEPIKRITRAPSDHSKQDPANWR